MNQISENPVTISPNSVKSIAISFQLVMDPFLSISFFIFFFGCCLPIDCIELPMAIRSKSDQNSIEIRSKSDRRLVFAIGLVLLGFTGFYWVLLGFTGFYWVLKDSNRLYWVLLGFTGFYTVVLGFTLGFIGCKWVLLGFTGFYWVL